MSLRERLARWLLRGSTPPVDIIPGATGFYGPGASSQPSHDALLAESLGVPATAARAIANRVAQLNPQVVVDSRDQSGTVKSEILDDHPAKKLLDKPHPNFPRSMLLRLTAQYIVTVGEAYWLKVGNGLRRPVELHPYPPGKVQPIVRANVISGYEIIDGNGRRSVLRPDQVVRFWYPDPENPWRSEGYLGPSGIAADASKFAQQHLRAHYQSDATPKTVLEAQPDAVAFDDAQLQRMWTLWREHYWARGGSKTGLPAVTPTGYKLVQLALQSGADIVPLLEYFRSDLLQAHAVPRAVLGEVVSGDRSSAETMQWTFDRYAVMPVAQLIQDGLTAQLAVDFDERIRIEFEEFCSEDKDYQLKLEAQDLMNKVRSINEIRIARGEDPAPWGEEPVGKTGEVPYDPAKASERADRPQVAPGQPPNGGDPAMQDAEDPVDEAQAGDSDEDRVARLREDEKRAHAKLRVEYARKRRSMRAA